jgi:hypothetical protein
VYLPSIQKELTVSCDPSGEILLALPLMLQALCRRFSIKSLRQPQSRPPVLSRNEKFEMATTKTALVVRSFHWSKISVVCNESIRTFALSQDIFLIQRIPRKRGAIGNNTCIAAKGSMPMPSEKLERRRKAADVTLDEFEKARS